MGQIYHRTEQFVCFTDVGQLCAAHLVLLSVLCCQNVADEIPLLLTSGYLQGACILIVKADRKQFRPAGSLRSPLCDSHGVDTKCRVETKNCLQAWSLLCPILKRSAYPIFKHSSYPSSSPHYTHPQALVTPHPEALIIPLLKPSLCHML